MVHLSLVKYSRIMSSHFTLQPTSRRKSRRGVSFVMFRPSPSAMETEREHYQPGRGGHLPGTKTKDASLKKKELLEYSV